MLILFSLGIFGFWLGVLALVNLVRDHLAGLGRPGERVNSLPLEKARAFRKRAQSLPANKGEAPEIMRAFQDLWNEIRHGA